MATSKKKSTKKKRTVAQPAPNRASTDPLVTRLEEIVHIMEGSSLRTLAYEDADLKIELSREGPAVALAPPPATAPLAVREPSLPVAAPPAEPTPRPESTPRNENEIIVRSPIVGTFYGAPSPGAPKFTDAGQSVKPGQTLCIIEAMKLMNEIECEVTGTVVEVMVENTQAVQYDDPLFRIAVAP